MGTIYGYLRASTAGQEYSYDAQKKQIAPLLKAWAEAGGQLGTIYCDRAVSGTTELFERPKGRKLNQVLRRGDKVVFAKLDRAFRSLADYASFALQMKDRGIQYAASDIGLDSSTPTGEFIYQVMASFAQLERQFISLRTREALAVRKAKKLNKICSTPPGWKRLPNDLMDVDEVERKLLEWVKRQHDSGFSWNQIAKQLKDWKLRRWNGTTYNYDFLPLAMLAREHNYPPEGGWRQRWLREKAAAAIATAKYS
jgi:DNA invertase Pin-like site-specific DNA recombinase